MTKTHRTGVAGPLDDDSASAAVEPLRPEAQLVLRQFRVVFNAVKAHFQQMERQSGIGGAQIWALSLIAQRPGLGVGHLARAMDVRQSTASNLVKTLVQRGLVVSARNAQDRRAVQLRPSPAGLEALSRAPTPFTGILPEALGRLDDETLSRLQADLRQLITTLALDPNGRDAQTPLATL